MKDQHDNKSIKSKISWAFMISGLFNLIMGIGFGFWEIYYSNFNYNMNINIGIISGIILFCIGLKLYFNILNNISVGVK